VLPRLDTLRLMTGQTGTELLHRCAIPSPIRRADDGSELLPGAVRPAPAPDKAEADDGISQQPHVSSGTPPRAVTSRSAAMNAAAAGGTAARHAQAGPAGLLMPPRRADRREREIVADEALSI
jgi:hypothetical protein